MIFISQTLATHKKAPEESLSPPPFKKQQIKHNTILQSLYL